MRFLLYNIRYGAGVGWQFHFPFPFSGYLKYTHQQFSRLVDFIESVNPDIIGLLEVDSGSFRSKKSCQATTLARQLKHFCVYESKYAVDSIWQKLPLTNKQGNAILTNTTIHGQKIHYFKKGIKRLMIELEMEDFVVLLVHLSLKYQHRHQQLHDIYQQVEKIKKPVIVAGDFNVLRGAHELEAFLEKVGLKNANKEGLLSHPSGAPRREIDFILHSPEIEVGSFEMPDVQFSDHRPLICDFKVKKK
ncbi:MAG: endonuclease/exonuclease/phosphatase family protein [Candidatus Omnitrophica bacterium]|nr:endonuclease/exonuclease/phosphatase family protein [Candidatus Omnitrophota bacterium]